MVNEDVKTLYQLYKTMCLDTGDVYIGIDGFEKIHNKAKQYVLRAYDKREELGGIPYCIMRLDNKYLYWVEIANNAAGKPEAGVNFITNLQFNMLFEKQLKNSRRI